ncbi:UPB1 [Mytilus edulis]|uniref:UPB1 n=1 Tax=Mytilus edulis TaxID=6550 RepID=A0A8S3V9Q6_MYTED|nr:UPB1 [Mytilus edulis]
MAAELESLEKSLQKNVPPQELADVWRILYGKELRLDEEQKKHGEEIRLKEEDIRRQKKADIKTEDMNKNDEVQRNQDEKKTGRRKQNLGNCRKKRNSKVRSYTTSYRADTLLRGGIANFPSWKEEQEKEDIVTLISILAEVKWPPKNWKNMSP